MKDGAQNTTNRAELTAEREISRKLMPINLGKISGIPILLDYSWFVIFFLIAFTVGFVSIPSQYPRIGVVESFFIGIVSAILLFASILVHELAHSLLARRNGMNIRRITLFIFGGVSEIEESSITPSLELKVAAVGPLTSVAIAVIAFAAWYGATLANSSVFIVAPLEYTALVNGIVAAFNLVPAFPMDGGRILRSILWSRSKDIVRATKKASSVGRGFGYAMMIGGVLWFLLYTDVIDGLWFILIGWFISNASKTAVAQTVIQQDLERLKVYEIMSRNVPVIGPDNSVEDLARLDSKRDDEVPVVDQALLVGSASFQEQTKRIPPERLSTTKVRDIMTPIDNLPTIKGYEFAEKAFNLLGSKRAEKIFVVDDGGKLLGAITRADIVQVIQKEEGMRAAMGARDSIGADGTMITVQQGMLFVLEQSSTNEGDWTASFDQGTFHLVNEKFNGAVKSFTFEALRKGSYGITLNFSATQPVDGRRPKVVKKAVRYSIFVS